MHTEEEQNREREKERERANIKMPMNTECVFHCRIKSTTAATKIKIELLKIFKGFTVLF
jgi:hypothetical protein